MRRLAVVAAAGVVSIGLTACEGGGGGDGPAAGASTIQGTVVSFQGGGLAFIPVQRTWGERLLADVTGLFVPNAHAAINGVEVNVAGATAVTEEDGFFVISGVPPGAQEIVFTFNGETATLLIDVPSNAVIRLGGVSVSNGQAQVREIEVEIEDDSDSIDNDSRDDDSIDDNSRDDNSIDDNSIDDDSRDDDSDDTSGPSGNSGGGNSGSDDDSRDDDSRD